MCGRWCEVEDERVLDPLFRNLDLLAVVVLVLEERDGTADSRSGTRVKGFMLLVSETIDERGLRILRGEGATGLLRGRQGVE